MNAGHWIAETMSRIRPPREPSAAPARPARSTAERLKAHLRQGDEVLAPRMLRQLLEQLKAVVDPLVSEVEGGRRAQALIDWYAGAEPAQRQDLWLLMSEHFMADPQRVKKAQTEYQAAVGTPDEAAAEVRYRRATVSPRRRLLQRFSANPHGIRFLVDLRAALQPVLRHEPRLQALDVEMEYMFSTWFDVGFLELRRISWDSPASLIEKLIRYEAVHDVRGWADMKNRLDSDRRCYGFFHPRLPGEPLIFVEVALMNSIAGSITPLLDEAAAPADLSKATTAIFYSISSTQTGLRGVSFGDSLIKHVVDTLKEEFPRLRTFATLSPIPGLRGWLSKNAPADLLAAWERWAELDEKAPEREALLAWTARYLGQELREGQPLDPVARFHLGNGARVERLHWGADPSAKGHKQAFGLMVNYLYDLPRLDKHRALLAAGKVPIGGAIKALYR